MLHPTFSHPLHPDNALILRHAVMGGGIRFDGRGADELPDCTRRWRVGAMYEYRRGLKIAMDS